MACGSAPVHSKFPIQTPFPWKTGLDNTSIPISALCRKLSPWLRPGYSRERVWGKREAQRLQENWKRIWIKSLWLPGGDQSHKRPCDPGLNETERIIVQPEWHPKLDRSWEQHLYIKQGLQHWDLDFRGAPQQENNAISNVSSVRGKPCKMDCKPQASCACNNLQAWLCDRLKCSNNVYATKSCSNLLVYVTFAHGHTDSGLGNLKKISFNSLPLLPSFNPWLPEILFILFEEKLPWQWEKRYQLSFSKPV